MKKYIVTLHEIVEYEVIVNAENRDEAMEKACAVWGKSVTPTADFNGRGHGVEPQHCDLADPLAPISLPTEATEIIE